MQVDFVLSHKTFSRRFYAPARCSTCLVVQRHLMSPIINAENTSDVMVEDEYLFSNRRIFKFCFRCKQQVSVAVAVCHIDFFPGDANVFGHVRATVCAVTPRTLKSADGRIN